MFRLKMKTIHEIIRARSLMNCRLGRSFLRYFSDSGLNTAGGFAWTAPSCLPQPGPSDTAGNQRGKTLRGVCRILG